MVMSAWTCIDCGARGTEERNDGIVHRTIICVPCQMKAQPTGGQKLPCGCVHWREGTVVHYTYCSPTCPTYLAFVDENRRVRNKMTMEHGHEVSAQTICAESNDIEIVTVPVVALCGADYERYLLSIEIRDVLTGTTLHCWPCPCFADPESWYHAMATVVRSYMATTRGLNAYDRV